MAQKHMSRPHFIPSPTFSGPRPGYVYTTRSGATGYYSDGAAKEIDCGDAKYKDTPGCKAAGAISAPFIDILLFPFLAVAITLGVWIFGGIIIALAWHKSSPQHKTAVLVIGILVCILISPVGLVLLQKYAHWPIKGL